MRSLIWVGLLAACRPFDITQPINCDSDWATGAEICREALRELGGTIDESADQKYTVLVEECGSEIGGEVSSLRPTTIVVCIKAIAEATHVWVIRHEIGHLLGFHAHLPCESGAVMTPRWSCAAALDPAYIYTELDRQSILF